MNSETKRDLLGRALVALAIGIAAGWFAGRIASYSFLQIDFEFLWRAVRLWSMGVDPYAMRPRAPFVRLWPLADRLFYPLPSLLVIYPLHKLVFPVACGVFVGVSGGLLAWRSTRQGVWPLLLFASPSFAMAALLGQWSPLLTLGAIAPWAGFLLACKPTLGLACFCYRPTWKGAISIAAIGLFSLLIMPQWPQEWLTNVRFVRSHPAPIMTPLGWPLALAILRWRQREARLLLAMACVPQLLFFADQLPLVLSARTRRELVFLTLSSCVVGGMWWYRHFLRPGAPNMAPPYVMLGCYLPALWIVLRRPNDGAVPIALQHLVDRLPPWIRGRTTEPAPGW